MTLKNSPERRTGPSYGGAEQDSADDDSHYQLLIISHECPSFSAPSSMVTAPRPPAELLPVRMALRIGRMRGTIIANRPPHKNTVMPVIHQAEYESRRKGSG